MGNEINTMEAVDGGIFNCRYDKYFTLVNADDNLFQFLGYTREEFAGLFHNRVLDAIYEGDRETILSEVERQLSTSKVFRYENRLVVKGGRTRWVWVSAELVEDDSEGEIIHCIFHDISREKNSQEQLAISEKRYDIIMSHIQDIIFELDCVTYSIYYSPNFKKKFGYEIPSHGFPDSMFDTDIIYEEDKPVLRKHFQSILMGQNEMEYEYRIKACDGSYLWVDVHATALRDRDNRLLKILGIISDIDQRKREIIKAQKEAVSDPLTGLLNRRECVLQIEKYMEQSHNPAAFMLIDVDNFKKVNDTYGHLYGDSVLNELAGSLRTVFRREDIIARIGGDEFVVFMTNMDTGSILEEKVKRIESVFKNFTVAEGTDKVGCSIGISFYPGHGNDFRSLFAKADAAMYQVKQKGKGWYCVYGEDMEQTDIPGLTPPSRTMRKSFHDHIIEQVFRIFLENPETGTAISILMELIGRVFHADRMLIFERDGDQRLVNTYQWQSEHVLAGHEAADGVKADIRGLPLEDKLTIYLDTVRIEDPAMRRWFTDRSVKAAITCCMKERDEFSTVIIYEDCHGTRIGSGEEQYTLMMISQIIHLFLLKENNAIRFQKQENIAEKSLLEQEIAHQEMIYRTALKETHINVWEYDVKTHTLRLTESAQEHHGFCVLEHVPESLMDGGYVHHRSRRDLLEMYRKLEEGQPHAEADILTRSADGSTWWWERIRYTMLFSEDGDPCCAVAIGEDITQQKKAEIVYQQELQLRMAFDSRMLASFRCNLDKNCVDYVEAQSNRSYPPGMTYEQLMEVHNRDMVNEEDKKRLETLMNREALIQAYQSGSTSITFEYRRKDENGSLSWVSATGRLLRDAESGDLYIYGTLEDINEKKNLELALKHRADFDLLTNVYNKDTAIQMIADALVKAHRKKNSYALLIFNVDSFTDLVRSSGYIAGDSILKELSSQLKIRYTSKKIIGRFYGDEFVVFLYDNPKPDLLWKDTKEVIKAMSLPYMFPKIKRPVSISCGMVFDDHGGTEFDELYQKARASLEAAMQAEAGKIVIYNENHQKLPDRQRSDAELQAAACDCKGYDSESEGILLRCMFTLVSAADLRPPLEHTLKELAAYYDADRAYVAELERECGRVREIYEWKKDELISIHNAKDLLPKTEELKEWEKKDLKHLRYIGDISSTKMIRPELYPVLRNLGIYSCFYGSLNEGDRPIGYIGIGNPRKNTDNTSVLTAIRYFLSNELIKRRLQEKQEFLSYHDELTGVFNRNSYKEYCMNLREEGMISLGVVSVDINGLKEINQIHGNRYGDSVIRIVAHIMEGEYPAARVYRFAGDEFLLICENISQDSFNGRLKQMKARMLEVCHVSVGSAWADIDISLDLLISSADERRVVAKQAYYNEKHDQTTWRNTRILKELLDEMSQNKFTVYLQPKVDARTGRLYGSEALVRYFDPKYGVVSPGKFVPYLETVGLIHYIDFFVFEQVCVLLKRWKQRGYLQVPVSLNFSRATLLEENLIDKMEQIVMRYGVDRSLVEIEITESLGEVERNTVAQIGNQMVQAGFHIILDDFGSKYSNLSFLSLLHFHNLKLDKSLVNHLLVNRNARIIVKNIVTLCKELNVEVLAEGVENKEQLEVLKQLQCYLVQGYFYNKPLPGEEFEKQYLTK